MHEKSSWKKLCVPSREDSLRVQEEKLREERREEERRGEERRWVQGRSESQVRWAVREVIWGARTRRDGEKFPGAISSKYRESLARGE